MNAVLVRLPIKLLKKTKYDGYSLSVRPTGIKLHTRRLGSYTTKPLVSLKSR